MQLLHALLEWAKRNPRLAQIGAWGLLTVFLGWLFRELTKTIFFDWLKDLLFRWFGERLGVADVNSLAYIIISILIPAALSALLLWFAVRHGMSLAGASVLMPATAPNEPRRNQWFLHAAFYVAHRRWPTKGERLLDSAMTSESHQDHLQSIKNTPAWPSALRALIQMRQAAADGRLIVWGKNDPSGTKNMDMLPDPQAVFQQIDKSHWVAHRVPAERLMYQPWNVHSVSDRLVNTQYGVPYRPKGDPFYALMISKEQIEAIWPPEKEMQ